MMKRINIISVTLILIFTACQKNVEDPYTLKFYGDTRENIGYSVAIASDGYIIAGQIEVIKRLNGNIGDSSNKNMAIIKTDWSGNVKWQVTTGGKKDDLRVLDANATGGTDEPEPSGDRARGLAPGDLSLIHI